jgi:hypothetical protein
MQLSNSNKALLITLFLSATIVLMAFNFHVKKQNDLIAETFYELLSEEDEEIEKKETLEEILKSFDELTTNNAFNVNKASEDFEDEEFKSTMEKLQSRNDNTIEKTQSHQILTNSDDDNSDTYDAINEIIKKRSDNSNANKNSSISFSLLGREKIHIPPPIYLCETSGTIVVSIVVNNKGQVTDASYNNASTSSNGCLVDRAIEYAKASIFNDSNKTSQIGTISFTFKGKR